MYDWHRKHCPNSITLLKHDFVCKLTLIHEHDELHFSRAPNNTASPMPCSKHKLF